jgi:hypothetical protein
MTTAAQAVQQMQKALDQMHVKLTELVSDITGETGMGIIRSIIAGAHDPQVLARHRDRRCKHDAETIAKPLEASSFNMVIFVPEAWRSRRAFRSDMPCAQGPFLGTAQVLLISRQMHR